MGAHTFRMCLCHSCLAMRTLTVLTILPAEITTPVNWRDASGDAIMGK